MPLPLIVACLWFANCEPPPEHYSPEPSRMEQEFEVEQAEAAPIAQASVNRGMGNRTSDVEDWRPLVAGHFEPEDVDRILCLMEHESGGNPNAANPRSSARGLMQVMASVWADEFDVTWDQLYEPEINLYVARQILDRQGFTAWAPYNRGLCR